MNCAILDDFQNVALTLADWDSISQAVETTAFHQHFDNEDELVEAVSDFEILVVMRERTPITASLLARLPKLKLVVTSGMRNASIDFAAAKARGVTVCGTASSSEPPTELTWALILGLARHIVRENDEFRGNGPWQSTVGIDLNGKQLGLIGLGKIGSKMARIGTAFGMKVVAWSPNLTRDRAEAAGAALAESKEALLETSDFVSIHLVLGDRSRGVIGSDELQRMRKTAFLINTSRAQIVDQAALVEALKNNWIAGAGLDVFDVEPLPADHPFRKLSNVLCTPHLGYVSQANYSAYFREAVEDIKAYLAGAPMGVLVS